MAQAAGPQDKPRKTLTPTPNQYSLRYIRLYPASSSRPNGHKNPTQSFARMLSILHSRERDSHFFWPKTERSEKWRTCFIWGREGDVYRLHSFRLSSIIGLRADTPISLGKSVRNFQTSTNSSASLSVSRDKV